VVAGSDLSRPSVPYDRTFCKATVALVSLIEYKVPSYRMFFFDIKEIRFPGEAIETRIRTMDRRHQQCNFHKTNRKQPQNGNRSCCHVSSYELRVTYVAQCEGQMHCQHAFKLIGMVRIHSNDEHGCSLRVSAFSIDATVATVGLRRKCTVDTHPTTDSVPW
jgi:hypothetical protein